MGKLDGLGFGGSVEDRTADTNGDKIDTTPANNKEEAKQEKVENAMENDEDISDDDIDADTSGDDSEDDSEEDDSDEDEESEDEDDSEEDEEDKSDEDPEEESSEEGEPDENKSGEESENKSFLGQDPKIDDSKLKAIENDPNLKSEEKHVSIMREFMNIHKDDFSEATRANFEKFVQSGNNAFLHMDDTLHKIVNEVNKYRDDIPVSERLSSAYQVIFREKIAKREQRKGMVKAEIRTQKVNKAASAGPSGGTGGKSTKATLTAEQRQVFKSMGVPIPKKYR